MTDATSVHPPIVTPPPVGDQTKRPWTYIIVGSFIGAVFLVVASALTKIGSVWDIPYFPAVSAILILILFFFALDKVPALKGLRVGIFNGATVVYMALPALLEFLTTVNWEEYLPSDQARWMLLGLAVLNIFFRVRKTTTPFGKSTLDSAP